MSSPCGPTFYLQPLGRGIFPGDAASAFQKLLHLLEIVVDRYDAPLDFPTPSAFDWYVKGANRSPALQPGKTPLDAASAFQKLLHFS